MRVDEKRTYLPAAAAEQAILRRRTAAGPIEGWLVTAPFVGPEVGRRFVAAGINYADDVGNCYVALGPGYVAHIEGRRPPGRLARDKGIRAPGYLVVFTLLARPDLVGATVRRIAIAAGVAKTTVGQILTKLEEEGIVGRRGKERRVLDAKRLFDLWLGAYENTVRPHLLLGRYRGPERTPDALDARIQKGMPKGVVWAWGGGAAAFRLTGFYRGPETVLHVAAPPPDLDRRLGVLRARDGEVVILKALGEVMLEGVKPGTAHPLLIYAELLTQGDERAREAAGVLADKFPVLRT